MKDKRVAKGSDQQVMVSSEVGTGKKKNASCGSVNIKRDHLGQMSGML